MDYGCVFLAIRYDRAVRYVPMETVFDQEGAYLRIACAKIAALQPDVVLVERGVARLAQEHLLDAKISLVLFVKPSVMHRISLMTGGGTFPSVDDAALERLPLGTCQKFYCKTAAHGKTLMYLAGCDAGPGCTVLLRGADISVLYHVKKLLRFAIFCAYGMRHVATFLSTLRADPVPAPMSLTPGM